MAPSARLTHAGRASLLATSGFSRKFERGETSVDVAEESTEWRSATVGPAA